MREEKAKPSEESMRKVISLQSYQHVVINNMIDATVYTRGRIFFRKKKMVSKKKGTMKQSEEPLGLIMYLSCWGPN
ncbi:unnamed protein product [Malus baccata var. baccata]